MRKVLYFIIVLLLVFPLVGLSSASRLSNCCHKEMPMADCMCTQHTAGMRTASGDDLSSGQGCCLLNSCRGAIAAKDTALVSTSLSLEFSGMIEEASFSPIMQPIKPELRRTGLLLAHLPSAPLYTLHCTFLI
ncbi:hypothetical protein FCL47_00880 [Desulfopila sp. IMCC35006]|uniref:hypothetical protein n=1 Tax=Desulfopila sp. IMCC35006 TaxID=2569542 RepID=UPI0010ABC606|nr:hypothetical protein [Desulfopila sp. IMCC35006]TKB28077.1 hypothetical protein FCL47_00880 [Desulfopila sp. IMCC35006]